MNDLELSFGGRCSYVAMRNSLRQPSQTKNSSKYYKRMTGYWFLKKLN